MDAAAGDALWVAVEPVAGRVVGDLLAVADDREAVGLGVGPRDLRPADRELRGEIVSAVGLSPSATPYSLAITAPTSAIRIAAGLVS